MKFLLFDAGSTLVFLLAYLAVVNLRRRAPLPVARPVSRRRAWPRLSHPR